MKDQRNLVLRSSLFAVFAVAVFGFQAFDVFGQGEMPGLAQLANRQKMVSAAAAKKEQFEAAMKVFPAAYELVIGGKLNPYYAESTIAAFAASEKYKSVYDQGVKLSDAIKYYKETLAQKENTAFRLAVLNSIFQEIHGRDSDAVEQVFYGAELMQQKATYTSLVIDQRQKLNASKTLRSEMINRAYQKAMGRNAKATDSDYWQPRSESFAEIITAARAYLYSPNGKPDLTETIVRAYAAKKKPSPNEQSIKWAMDDFSYNNKKIYAEMLEDKFYTWQ